MELGSTPKERRAKGGGGGYPWGDKWPPTGNAGNYADESFREKFPSAKPSDEEDPDAARNAKGRYWIEGYVDGFAATAPVGSFPPNDYGIFDLVGNVSEWCEDLYEEGSKDRVLRGASWFDFSREALQSTYRNHNAPTFRHSNVPYGFRCVLELSTPPAAALPSDGAQPSPEMVRGN